jgi:hypothetical protein
MIPDSVKAIDIEAEKEVLSSKVQDLSIADLESISIADISALNNSVLKDLLNDAVRNRLAYHLGGTYTSAPKMSIAEFAKTGTV